MSLVTTIRGAVDRSPIGEGLASTPTARFLYVLPTVLLFARYLPVYVWGVSWPPGLDYETGSWLCLGLAVAYLLVLARGRRAPLGLRLRPVQGFAPWLRYTAVAGLLVLLVAVPVALVLYLSGQFHTGVDDPGYCDPVTLRRYVVRGVLEAPFFEESLFRLVALSGLSAAVGRWRGLLVTTVLFGLWHWYVPDPTNLLSGLFFGWAYLASGSLLVSMGWHALGNLCVLLANLALAPC